MYEVETDKRNKTKKAKETEQERSPAAGQNRQTKTGIFAQRARVDQAIGLYYRKENVTF